ncbi:hypothetical protein AOC36_06485 [Erysipelothrix larvae]|uniref:Uncharacterized protein n=1 Tax=Erysipelothrix larvae TaxID=1514105 RepID=A0A120JTQ7_9FIRM|nr:hypothetical protein [Erysipelothrix larvae]AMC93645.1 hypothetical protein AOC36_06485 [Erysipelothrix larvae]
MIDDYDKSNFNGDTIREDGPEELNIEIFFEFFKELLSNPEIIYSNTLSLYSCLLDCLGLITILNFFNTNVSRKNINDIRKSNNLIIELFSIILSEFNKLILQPGIVKKGDFYGLSSTYISMLTRLRNNLHQFRFSDFNKKLTMIDTGMGRSRDIKNPYIDICLHFEIIDKCRYMIGTNQFEYVHEEIKNDTFVKSMTLQLRLIQNICFAKTDIFNIRKAPEKPNYKWIPYSYSDIIKSNKDLGEREIDRLIIALDVTSSIYEFFTYLVDIGEYIKEVPYLVYFYRKMISIHLDETIDNIQGFISKSQNNEMKKIFISLISDVKEEDIQQIKILRNNLHYQHQERFIVGDIDTSYRNLKHLLYINESIMRRIGDCVNCNPTKWKEIGYRFLRWVQS